MVLRLFLLLTALLLLAEGTFGQTEELHSLKGWKFVHHNDPLDQPEDLTPWNALFKEKGVKTILKSRSSSLEHGPSTLMTYHFNNAGQLISKIAIVNDSNQNKCPNNDYYTYNSIGQLIEWQKETICSPDKISKSKSIFRYDPQGRKTAQVVFPDLIKNSGPDSAIFTYKEDQNGNVTQLDIKGIGFPSIYTYTYDTQGNQIQEHLETKYPSQVIRQDRYFKYFSSGRLWQEGDGNSWLIYTRDPNGLIQEVWRKVESRESSIQSEAHCGTAYRKAHYYENYRYDSIGNLKTILINYGNDMFGTKHDPMPLIEIELNNLGLPSRITSSHPLESGSQKWQVIQYEYELRDSMETIREVNNQVWIPFCKAFEKLDYQIMADIHLADLIRIPANSNKIIGYKEYIEGYKKSFARCREKQQKRSITLRFTERIYNENTGSERGIYRLKVSEPDKEDQAYYGKFHVLLKKVDGQWKILADYDSNEGETIGKPDFDAAKEM